MSLLSLLRHLRRPFRRTEFFFFLPPFMSSAAIAGRMVKTRISAAFDAVFSLRRRIRGELATSTKDRFLMTSEFVQTAPSVNYFSGAREQNSL
jgi:hypothetical protein